MSLPEDTTPHDSTLRSTFDAFDDTVFDDAEAPAGAHLPAAAKPVAQPDPPKPQWCGWIDVREPTARFRVDGDWVAQFRGLASAMRRSQWWQFARDGSPVRLIEQEMRNFAVTASGEEQAAALMGRFRRVAEAGGWLLFER